MHRKTTKPRLFGFCRLSSLVTVLVLPVEAAVSAGASTAGGDKSLAAPAAPIGNYARACEPVVKFAFMLLPPGAVEPEGWLRDWAESAANGITGHLDEHHAVFGEAWKGVRVNAPNAEPDGTG